MNNKTGVEGVVMAIIATTETHEASNFAQTVEIMIKMRKDTNFRKTCIHHIIIIRRNNKEIRWLYTNANAT